MDHTSPPYTPCDWTLVNDQSIFLFSQSRSAKISTTEGHAHHFDKSLIRILDYYRSVWCDMCFFTYETVAASLWLLTQLYI